MTSFVATPEIAGIFDRPGDQWTKDERNAVKHWLNVPPQLTVMLLRATLHLGPGTTADDAEDAWQTFCVSRLDRVISRCNPAKGRHFPAFLSLCFGRDCQKTGRRLRRQRGIEVPIEPDDAHHPVASDRQAEQHEQRRALRTCLEKLSTTYRVAIDRYYYSGESVAQMAASLAITEVNAKVRLHRARTMLRDCLRGLVLR